MIDRKYLAAGAALAVALTATSCRGGSGSSSATTAAPAATTAPAAAESGTATAESGTAMTESGTATAESGTAMTESGTATADSGTAMSESAAAMTPVDCPATTDGLTADTIKLGTSNPLSGPAAAYSSIPKGMNAWFQHLNDTDGGFKLADGTTRKIEWIVLDDQYTPTKTVENAKQLVEKDKVFALLAPLGTPTNSAIREYMNQKQVPQMFVATGATTWGKDHDKYPWTIGYQPDYESEGIAYAQYILKTKPDAKIGVLYQNDDFGKDYLFGLTEGLGDKASQIVSKVTYEVTDTTVDNQVSQIKDAGVDAIVVVAVPKFATQAMQRISALGWEPAIKIVAGVSTSVAAVMQPAGLTPGEGFVSSFYTKDPTDPAMDSDPGVSQYREILGKYEKGADSNDGYYLFGMSIAQSFEQVIESVQGPLCRESLNASANNLSIPAPPLLVDGIRIKTGPGDAFPVQQIQLKQFDSTKVTWTPIGELVDTESAKG